jgi:hypothetical protein
MPRPIDYEPPNREPPADEHWLNHRLDPARARTLRRMWQVVVIASLLALLTILGFYGDVFRRLLWP